MRMIERVTGLFKKKPTQVELTDQQKEAIAVEQQRVDDITRRHFITVWPLTSDEALVTCKGLLDAKVGDTVAFYVEEVGPDFFGLGLRVVNRVGDKLVANVPDSAGREHDPIDATPMPPADMRPELPPNKVRAEGTPPKSTKKRRK